MLRPMGMKDVCITVKLTKRSCLLGRCELGEKEAHSAYCLRVEFK